MFGPGFVNQLHLDCEGLQPGDLPDWDLGLVLDLPDPPAEPPGWFADVERVVVFVASLLPITDREFVVGVCDHDRGISEDLMTADASASGLSRLRQFVGVGAS